VLRLRLVSYIGATLQEYCCAKNQKFVHACFPLSGDGGTTIKPDALRLLSVFVYLTLINAWGGGVWCAHNIRMTKKPAEAGYLGVDRMPSMIFVVARVLINTPRFASHVPGCLP
jgi:hypothetical protein